MHMASETVGSSGSELGCSVISGTTDLNDFHLNRFGMLRRSNALSEEALPASLDLDGGDDDWIVPHDGGHAGHDPTHAATAGRPADDASPVERAADDAATVVPDPSPPRRARRSRPAAKPMKVPPKAKWLSVPVPAKYGGPVIYVFMPCALAGSVKEGFNEDLKAAIFEYADSAAKIKQPAFQYIKAKLRVCGWEVAHRRPKDMTKSTKKPLIVDPDF